MGSSLWWTIKNENVKNLNLIRTRKGNEPKFFMPIIGPEKKSRVERGGYPAWY